MRRLDCHTRIKEVRDRYHTALRTVNLLIGLATQQPDYLYENDVTLTEMRALVAELHDVYFARMFACFESSLRHYWRTRVRDTKPSTEQLVSAIADRLGMPQDTKDAVQEIRDFRNYLVHEEHQVRRRLTIDEAAGHLNTYLARLPLEW
jgi:hypothetical protein